MNIIFEQLEVQNFKSIGECITLNYTDFTGLNFIIGTNLDQPGSKNGSGKSALAVDALVFALFGRTLKNINNIYIANRNCNKKLETFSKVTFLVDNIRYRSESYIKNGTTVKMLLYKENSSEETGWEDLTQCSVIKTRQYIQENILHCTFDIFKTAIIIAASDCMNFYEGMNKNQKRLYIENIFNLNCFGDMYNLVKGDINDTKREISFSNNEIINLTNYLNELNAKSEEYNNSINNTIISLKQKLLTNVNLYKSIEKTLNEKFSEYTSLDNSEEKLIEYTNKLTQLNNEKQDIEKVIFETKYKQDSLLTTITELKNIKNNFYESDIEKLNKNITEYSEKIIFLKEELNNKQELLTYFDSIKQQIETCEISIKNNYSEIDKYDKDIIKANCKIDSISASKSDIDNIKDVLCNDCKKKIDEKFNYTSKETIINKLNLFVNQNNIERTKFINLNIQLNESLTELKQKLIERQTIIDDINVLNSDIKAFAKNLNTAVHDLEEKKKLLAIKNTNNNFIEKENKISEFSKIIIEKTNEKNKIIEKINNLNILVNDVKSTVEKRRELASSINLLKSDLKYKKTEILNIKTEYENAKLKTINNPFTDIILSTNDKLNNENDKLDNLNKNYKHMEILKDVFSENGVKKHIIKDIVSLLNSLIQKYLSEIGAEFLVCFDDTFDFKFITLNGECEYSNFSAGEKQRIQIATTLAFRDIILNDKINSNILIIDEMLDQAVDSIAIKKITNILQRKSVELNQAIFVISHRSEITEDNIFNNIIEVIKEKGISTINII